MYEDDTFNKKNGIYPLGKGHKKLLAIHKTEVLSPGAFAL